MRKALLFLFVTFAGLGWANADPTRPMASAEISILPVDFNFKMNFYPNPCPKTLNVDINFDKSGSSQIEIHFRNLIGKEMMEVFTDSKADQNNHYEIDMNELPAGIYLMEISTYNNGVASKITKRVTKL